MQKNILTLIKNLYTAHTLTSQELLFLLNNLDAQTEKILFSYAQKATRKIFSNNIYLRGLIEFSNYCKNNCYYCGIRYGNNKVIRYRLSQEDILNCCKYGYQLGLRTFVLQGGEDYAYNDLAFTNVIYNIKKNYPECAVTISAGERPAYIYKQWFNAGADRYLLRHETADPVHYSKLHPSLLQLKPRLHCLYSLKEIGYQVGTGFMVGSPYQTIENIVQDLKFIESFQPHMVGIGPFISHKDTPFAKFPNGNAQLTLRLIAILRLLNPKFLLPATTALNTISKNGHQLGILAGANVIMPNLSPAAVRNNYSLYDNKRSFGNEAAEGILLLKNELAKIGYMTPISRGDYQK